jgi:hypothetical protein
MARNIYVQIDEDVSSVVRKLKKLADPDLILVLPKDSLLFSNVINMKLLKKHADALGKNIAVLTMDPEGQRYALEVGFELRSFEALRRSGPNMDIAQKPPRVEEERFPIIEPVMAEPIIYDGAWKNEAELEPIEETPAPQRIRNEHSVPVAIAHEPSLQQPRTKKRKGWLLATAGALVLLLLAYLLIPLAEITIYAHTEPIVRDLRVAVKSDAQGVDSTNLSMPSHLFEKNIEFSKGYDSSGRVAVGGKSSGEVQIYNYTGRALRLNTATTKLLVGQKVYRFENDVANIRASRNFAGTNNADPASLTPVVRIVAEEGGEEYNLPGNTRFEILNEVLGPNQSLYAINPDVVEGGSNRFSTVVTQEDLDKAGSDLRNSLLAKLSADQKDDGYILLASGTELSDVQTTFDRKANDQSQNFRGTIKAKGRALLVRDADLQKLVNERVAMTLEPGQEILADNRNINYLFTDLDLTAQTATLIVSLEAKKAAILDKGQIISRIKGRTTTEVRTILEADPAIDGAEIKLKPFWYNRVPSLPTRVKLEIKSS